MPASNRDEELARELFSSVQVSPTHGPFQWLQIYPSEGQDEPDLSASPPNPGHPRFFLQRDLEQQLEGLLASLVSGIRLEATSYLQHSGR